MSAIQKPDITIQIEGQQVLVRHDGNVVVAKANHLSYAALELIKRIAQDTRAYEKKRPERVRDADPSTDDLIGGSS